MEKVFTRNLILKRLYKELLEEKELLDKEIKSLEWQSGNVVALTNKNGNYLCLYFRVLILYNNQESTDEVVGYMNDDNQLLFVIK